MDQYSRNGYPEEVPHDGGFADKPEATFGDQSDPMPDTGIVPDAATVPDPVQELADKIVDVDEMQRLVRAVADERAAAWAQEDPNRFNNAAGIADEYMEGIVYDLGVSESAPGTAEMRAGFLKLYYAFTDPSNYDDTLTDTLMTDEIVGLWGLEATTQVATDTDTFGQLAGYWDTMASHIALAGLALDAEEVVGLNADQRYAIAKSKIEEALLTTQDGYFMPPSFTDGTPGDSPR